MRVAICDDEKGVLEYVVRCVKKEFSVFTQEVEYFAYSDPCLFLDDAKKIFFDVVFLDLKMPVVGGLDVAMTLRECSPRTMILFVSNQLDEVFEAIKAKPDRFIRKTRLDEELPEAIAYLWKKLGERLRKLEYNCEYQKTSVFLEDIYWIESYKNYATLYTNGEPIRIKRSISSLEKEFPDVFFRCHKSFLVNLDKIEKFDSSNLILSNGKDLPVGRQWMDKVKAIISQRMRGL